MKGYIIRMVLCLSLLCINAAWAQQTKIMERSSKKVPVWIDRAEQEYIITSAVAPSLEQAKNQCLDQVKTRILESVAQHVNFQTQSSVNQTILSGGEVADFTDSFASTLETKAANIPFIKGVSISKVEESYWERLWNKTTQTTTYRYAIKYPFPRIELKKLIADFERQDAEKYAQLTRLQEGLELVTSTSQIADALLILGELKTYFFDRMRAEATNRLLAAYTNLYAEITPQMIEEKLGYARFVFLLHGRKIAIASAPQIKAACATQIKVSTQGDNEYVIRYSSDMCPIDEQSEITLFYRLERHVLRQTLYFTATDQSVTIAPVGRILLSKSATDSMQNLSIEMDVEVKNAETVHIQDLTLELPNVRNAIRLENINVTLNGTGTHRLKLNYTERIEWIQTFLMSVARGTISGTHDTSINFKRNFLLPFTSH